MMGSSIALKFSRSFPAGLRAQKATARAANLNPLGNVDNPRPTRRAAMPKSMAAAGRAPGRDRESRERGPTAPVGGASNRAASSCHTLAAGATETDGQHLGQARRFPSVR